jgi:hypothetical protein
MSSEGSKIEDLIGGTTARVRRYVALVLHQQVVVYRKPEFHCFWFSAQAACLFQALFHKQLSATCLRHMNSKGGVDPWNV